MATSITKTSPTTLLDLPQELLVDAYKHVSDDYTCPPMVIITVTNGRISYKGSRLPLNHLSTNCSLQDAISEALASTVNLLFNIPDYETHEGTKLFMDDLANKKKHSEFVHFALPRITKVEVNGGQADLITVAKYLPSMKCLEVNDLDTEEANGLINFHTAIPGTATDREFDEYVERVLQTTKYGRLVNDVLTSPSVDEALSQIRKIILRGRMFEANGIVLRHPYAEWPMSWLEGETELVSPDGFKGSTRVSV